MRAGPGKESLTIQSVPPTDTIAKLRRIFSKAKLRKLARKIARSEKYTLPEVIEMLKRSEKQKRRKGRPARANLDLILNAAAKAMAKTGRYTQVAARLGLSPRQLSNLIQRKRNRLAFDKKVKAYSQIKKKTDL